MKLLTVLAKGLTGGSLLCCAAIWIGALPASFETKFYLQLATIMLSVPLMTAWLYDFK